MPRPLTKKAAKAMPVEPMAAPSPAPSKDTSHIRMAAWLAVAAVAVSSGAISSAASAAAAPTAPKTDPNTAITRQLNALQMQGSQIEMTLNNIQRELQDIRSYVVPDDGSASDTDTGTSDMMPMHGQGMPGMTSGTWMHGLPPMPPHAGSAPSGQN